MINNMRLIIIIYNWTIYNLQFMYNITIYNLAIYNVQFIYNLTMYNP